MDQNVRVALLRACRELETAFCGTTAAFEGFVRPRRSDDACTVKLEVFMVPGDRLDEFDDVANRLESRLHCELGVDVIVLARTPEQTTSYYAEDFEAIRALAEVGECCAPRRAECVTWGTNPTEGSVMTLRTWSECDSAMDPKLALAA